MKIEGTSAAQKPQAPAPAAARPAEGSAAEEAAESAAERTREAAMAQGGKGTKASAIA